MPRPLRDPSVRHEYDGAELRTYATPRTSTGRTFVLLHGIGMSHHTFTRLAAALRGHGRVVAFDLAGFGANATPTRRVGIADHARFVERALVERGVERAIVVGHSMGTQIAVELAIRAPELVEGVVLIGPVVDPERPGVVRQGLALARDTAGEPLPVDLLVLGDYIRGGIRWYLRQLPEMMQYPIQRRLSEVTQPVLVVRGHDDPVGTRDWCERLLSHARRGSLLELDASRHVVPRTEPEALARGILRFADTGTRTATAPDAETTAAS